jgi:hypothetical protein
MITYKLSYRNRDQKLSGLYIEWYILKSRTTVIPAPAGIQNA